MKELVLATVFLVLVPLVGNGQSPPDRWDSVKQLREGKKIRVVDGDFQKIKGRFVSATDDAIAFRVKKNGHLEEVALPRHDVRMVSIRHSKAKSVLLLILAGALIGASAMAGPDYDCFSCDWDTSRPTGAELAIGAGVGAVALGIAGGLAEPFDEIIYFHDPNRSGVPAADSPVQSSSASEGSNNLAPSPVGDSTSTEETLLSGAAGKPEGGNILAPLPGSHKTGVPEETAPALAPGAPSDADETTPVDGNEPSSASAAIEEAEPATAPVEQKVHQLGVGATVKVKLRDGQKIRGLIQGIEPEHFLLDCAGEGCPARIPYGAVRKVKSAKHLYEADSEPDEVQAAWAVGAVGVGGRAKVERLRGSVLSLDQEHFALLLDHAETPRQIAYHEVRGVSEVRDGASR